jgi:hypothetical protein
MLGTGPILPGGRNVSSPFDSSRIPSLELGPEDDPTELLKVMDALGETVRSICVDEPLVATFLEVL